MKIEQIEISGFKSAIMALRKPYKGKVLSDIRLKIEDLVKLMKYKHSTEILRTSSSINVNDRDLELMKNLVRGGDEHAKCIRGIRVTLDVSAPRYFWSEHDTYRIGVDPLSSESTMHTILKENLSDDDFACYYPHVLDPIIKAINEIKKSDASNTDKIRDIKSMLPDSYIQTRTIQYSYQALRRIYRQRHNHRLKEWRDFCEFIETLPFSEELITLGLK